MDEEIRESDLVIITQIYAYNAAFDGSTRRSAQLLKLLVEKGLDFGYFLDPAKSLFIADLPYQEEAANQ